MGQQFSPVGRLYSFFNLAQEPFVIVHEALDHFSGQQLGVAATVGGKTGQFGRYVGVEVNL